MPVEMRLGELANIEMGQSPDSAYVTESGSGIPFLQGNAEFGAVSPASRLVCSRPNKICQKGDILISVRAQVGALNKADRAYCIGRGLAAVRFTRVSADFGWHLLNKWAPNLLAIAQGSTFQAVSKHDLEALRVVYFDAPEQRRIAEILDTADVAIQSTERLIAKLKALKQGLLHDLLTRGLDAEGRLRDPLAHPEQFVDSPLGRMPRGWEVRTLGEVSLNKGDYGSGAAALELDRDLPRYVRVTDITEDGLLNPNSLASITRADATGYYLKPGDLLFARSGATVGKTYLYNSSDGECAHAGYVIKFALDQNGCDARYVFHWTHSHGYWAWVGSTLRQGAQPNINAREYSTVRLPCPSRDEQRRIAEILDAHDARLRAEEAYRDKLLQLKRGLMEDLLTGRVRV